MVFNMNDNIQFCLFANNFYNNLISYFFIVRFFTLCVRVSIDRMDVRGVPYENNPPLRENILTVGMCGFTSTMSQLSRYTGGDEVEVLANDHVICACCHRTLK